MFLLHAALTSPQFFPTLADIGVWDEAIYINNGRKLLDGQMPLLNNGPAVAGLYALTYLPVRTSPHWLVHSCSIARFVLFGLLWLGAFLVATELAGFASPFIVIALVAVSPPVSSLIYNGTDALFSAMAGFSLWQFLSFQRTRKHRHLWLCSFLLGVAALSRNEGLVLFLVFLGLCLTLCVFARVERKALTACFVPFAVLVGGYVLIYGLRTGEFTTGIAERSYFNFEQGQGAAFAESYGTLEYYGEGQLDARQLFGTPEENGHSVLTAIRRNPTAYLQRIPRLVKRAINDVATGYFWYFGVMCFAFAARGFFHLIQRKSFLLLATLPLWSAYSVLYVLVVSRPSHVLIPFLSVFSLAAVGISAFSRNLESQKERWLWSACLLALAGGAAARGWLPNGPFVATLCAWLGLWLVWLVTDSYRGFPNIKTVACLILLCVALILRFGLHTVDRRVLGTSSDEQAVLFLSKSFRPDAQIAAWGPGKVMSAKMNAVTMAGTLRDVKSDSDVREWLSRHRVEAIYVDEDLRRYEPTVWATLQEQIGNGLTVAFETPEANVQILVPK